MCAEDHNAKTDQIQGELVANTVLDAEPNTLLDEREVAKLLRISRYTVRNERLRGKIGYVQVGSKIFYDQSQVADYLRAWKVPPWLNPPKTGPDKSETTGSPSVQRETPKRTRGVGRGSIQLHDKQAVQVLAQRIFTRPVSSSQTGCSTMSGPTK